MELDNFKKSETEKNYYESLNFQTAQKILKISVDVGVGKFKLSWE
jgi:hypothetical protein